MTAIAYENVALTDGYQIWEGDSTLESDSPLADLLVTVDELRESTDILGLMIRDWITASAQSLDVFVWALGVSLVEVVRANMAPVVHTPTQGRPEYGSAAEHAHYEAKVNPQRNVLANRAFTALDEDTQRKTVYWSRRKVAYTASLAVPTSLHASDELWAVGLCAEKPKASAPCTCETDPAARALYLQGEYGVQQYNDHEWDVLSAAFAEYNALPKWERERYTSLATPQARALAAHFAQQAQRDEAEKSCRATRHYFGLELEMLRDEGTPEIAAPAAKTTATRPENKYGVRHHILASERWIRVPRQDGMGLEPVRIVTFVGDEAPANDAAIEQAATWEDYEFNSYRAPVVAGCWLDEGDESRGYLVHESNRLNDTSQSWLKSQIAAEYDRRKQYGDVWHSPHRPLIEKRRKDGSTYTVRGRSRFYVMQQNKQKWAMARRHELLTILCREIGREIHEPAVWQRITQLGFEGALTALQAKAVEMGSTAPEARTKVLV